MAWFKVDDRFYSSRKVLRIPRRFRVAAVGLWTLAGSWSAHDLTDGFIPWYMLDEFGADEELADALVSAGLWLRIVPDLSPGDTEGTDRDTEGTGVGRSGDGENYGPQEAGYQFLNWDEYQPTRTETEERRRKEREKKRNQRRGPNGKFAGQGRVPDLSPGDTLGDTLGSPPHVPRESAVPVPSRPVPSPSNTSSGFAEAHPDAAQLIDWLNAQVVDNGFKEPADTKANRDAARLLLTRDGVEPERAKAVASWALNDEFWRTNIRSFSKLREKFETLEAQMQRPQRGSGPMTFDEQRNRANNDLFMEIAESAAGGEVWNVDSWNRQIAQ